MAVRGRRATSPDLKLVAGTYRKSRAAAGSARTPAPGRPGPVPRPPWLLGRAAEIWDEHAPALAEAGVLRPGRAHHLAAWCQLAERIEEGAATMRPPQLAQWRAMGQELGLSPAAPSPARRGPPDPTDRFFESPNAHYFRPEEDD